MSEVLRRVYHHNTSTPAASSKLCTRYFEVKLSKFGGQWCNGASFRHPSSDKYRCSIYASNHLTHEHFDRWPPLTSRKLGTPFQRHAAAGLHGSHPQCFVHPYSRTAERMFFTSNYFHSKLSNFLVFAQPVSVPMPPPRGTSSVVTHPDTRDTYRKYIYT